MKKNYICILLTLFILAAPGKAYAEEQKIPVVDTPQEAVQEVSAADGEAFFSIDVRKDPGDLVTKEISSDVADIIDGNDSNSAKAREVAETLEDSGYYYAEKSGTKVDVTSLYANMRIMVETPFAENFDTHNAESAAYYRDHYLLSYRSEEETKNAFDLFVEKYGEENVLLDIPIKLEGANSWGTAYMGLDKKSSAAEGGEPVTVAVLDSGIERNHAIFSGRNVLQGYDFVNSDDDPQDDNSHGTAVSGIIAESTPDNVSILPVKVSGANGSGSLMATLYAIEYAQNEGASIINMSLGGNVTNAVFESAKERFNKIRSENTVIICAAGNEGTDLDGEDMNVYPAEMDDVICVGSFDKNGAISSTSNYGDCMDFAAPGKRVYVATAENDYTTMSGTSFAAPHITAAAAILKSEDESLSNKGMETRLAEISVDMGDTGWDRYFGSGCPSFKENEVTDPDDISGADVLDIKDKVYTGNAVTQNIRLELNGKTLTEGTDYNVTYENNTDAGTAKILIEGTGSYTGTIEKSFRISPKSVSPEVILDESTFTYDGNAKTPTVTVRVDGREADPGSYDVTLPKGRTDAGTYNITAALKGNYTGSGSAEFTIEPKQVTPTVTLVSDTFIYNGSIKTPVVVKVTDGDTEIDKEYYSVSYDDGRVDAGTYKVNVSLKGNYEGNGSSEFTIEPKKVTPVITLVPDTFEYDGSVKTPDVTVNDGDTEIDEEYCDITYDSGRTEPGDYNVTVSLRGNYEGSGEASFSIKQKEPDLTDITECNISELHDKTYTGSAITQDITVSHDGNALAKNTDYKVTYKNNTNAGTAKVIIEGIGNYTGTIEKSFKIAPKAVTPEMVLDKSVFTYDGNVKTPSVTVMVDGEEADPGSYDLILPEGRTDAGTYKIEATLKGNYEGSCEATFRIEQKGSDAEPDPAPVVTDISECHISDLKDKTYTGSAITQNITVSHDGNTLMENTDYKVTYENNTDAGIAKVIIEGIGSYTGTIEKSFVIAPKEVVPEVTLSQTSVEYTGSRITPDVRVKADGNTLDAKDYDIVYDNGRTNAGTYKVAVTLKGNYKGTGESTFEITRRHLSPEIILSPNSFVYDGQKKTPSVTVRYGGKEIRSFEVKYPEGMINAGTYTVTARLTGNYTGEDHATFAIYGATSPLTAKGKTVKVNYKKAKKKTQKIKLSKAIRIRNRVGKLSYSKLQGNQKITISKKTGTITLKKGLKKGTYRIRVLVTEKGNPNYSMDTKTVIVKIKVR